MMFASRVLQRLLRLPAPQTRHIVVRRDLPIPAADGVTLLADHWAPAKPGGPLPTVLMRSPYGRRGLAGTLLARAYAERGFQVVLASVRGTFGSGGGEFLAMREDREDGQATLDWVTRQPWFDGSVLLAGPSYLGYTQWAVAAGAPACVKGMVPHVTSARLALAFLRPGRIELETLLSWSVSTATQERPFGMIRSILDGARIRRAMRTLPLAVADQVALGRQWPFFQECVHHDREDPYWRQWDHSADVASVSVPVNTIAGWYDIFLADQLRDYRALVRAGRNPRLTIGPWVHASLEGAGVAVREAVDWGGALCRDQPVPARKPVRLHVMGSGRWREFDQWPPADHPARRWHLAPGGGLAAAPVADAAPSRFRYDPAHPTPSLGGARLEARGGGRVDNAPLERRADVLVFTSPPLERDLEVIGEVGAELWIRSDRPSTDLFVRLCVVDERGRSTNVCDDLVRAEVDGVTKVGVELSPTAQLFRRGQRIRVLVSAGAFPRYARNLGGTEPLPTGTRLYPATIEVWHDPDHPSAILLPTASPAD
ncbi:CocE/NonD family hydrolase [Kutzneria albida]|uniref:X-Pro dipeptidyl-peptidase n=1 Tax=Kutzneria albida DSM 43870 TaxID=1449976 RepID=W5W854_9PSEU|nr:CocE/NonD family hydrolase [Kutzneria albida]AHH96696.1 X-Pro dipeptidyl-peptidase [Kutzneria albida DSM 43870]